MNATKVTKPKPTSNTNGKETVPSTLALITLSPDKRKEFLDKVENLKKEVGIFKISDDLTRNKASEFLSRIKKAQGFLEDRRKEIVSPFNDEVKKINSDFKVIQQPLETLESTIKAELKRDFNEQEAKRIEMEKKAREEEEKKLAKLRKELESKDALTRAAAENKAETIKMEAESKVAAVAPQTKVYTSSGSTQFRKVWKWEMIDVSKLPDAYKIPNEVMLNSAVKGGIREIAGVRIYEDTNVAGGR